jgi:hypothetical protein
MGQKAKKVGIVLDKSRYRLQTLIHRKYVNQASRRHDYFSEVVYWRFVF